MNVAQYLEKRRLLQEQQPPRRRLCEACLQPTFGCYCAFIKRFDPGINFVILLHPLELSRRIATGRMSHLCLENSHLIVGHDYTGNVRVEGLLRDPGNHCVMLYPGAQAMNLSEMQAAERLSVTPAGKKLTVFVIDGTWATARQTVRLSRNLHALPRVCFTPPGPSNFRVRKQPKPHCYSTIEAVHHLIDLVGGYGSSRPHDNLLEVFNVMVERQLSCIQGPRQHRKRLKSERRDALRLQSGELST